MNVPRRYPRCFGGIGPRRNPAGRWPCRTETRGASTGTLAYPARDNVDFREGTLEFWFKPAFDPPVPPTPVDYRGLLVLVRVAGENGGLSLAYFSGGMYRGQAGLATSLGGKRGKGLPCGMTFYPKKDEWHHLAIGWKEPELVLYLDGGDGKGGKTSKAVQPELLTEMFGPVGKEAVCFGDQWGKAGRMVIDEFRLSTVLRQPEELGYHGQLKPDPYTAILDPFESDSPPDGRTRTRPIVILAGEGGLPTATCALVPGKYGKGLALFRDE